MNANEIKKEIEKIKYQIFLEQMADFLNWKLYYKLVAEKEALEKKLKEIED